MFNKGELASRLRPIAHHLRTHLDTVGLFDILYYGTVTFPDGEIWDGGPEALGREHIAGELAAVAGGNAEAIKALYDSRAKFGDDLRKIFEVWVARLGAEGITVSRIY